MDTDKYFLHEGKLLKKGFLHGPENKGVAKWLAIFVVGQFVFGVLFGLYGEPVVEEANNKGSTDSPSVYQSTTQEKADTAFMKKLDS